MARKRLASRLHLLTVHEIQTAPEGDHSDGGGLLLRVRGEFREQKRALPATHEEACSAYFH
jgi:hypothetical protein